MITGMVSQTLADAAFLPGMLDGAPAGFPNASSYVTAVAAAVLTSRQADV